MDVLCTAAGVGAHVGEHGAVQDDPHERRQPEGRRPCSNGADEAQQVAEEWLHAQREYVSRVGACQPREAMQRPTTCTAVQGMQTPGGEHAAITTCSAAGPVSRASARHTAGLQSRWRTSVMATKVVNRT